MTPTPRVTLARTSNGRARDVRPAGADPRRGRFLAVFEQVSQAVGYAHQKGVIHRDLKPANVMVGDVRRSPGHGLGHRPVRGPEAGDGETARGEPAATVEYSPHADARTPQSDLTQAGAVLGTPAYMPPEQAIGAVDQIGKRSDVFGLGAILCVILTGKPPYVGGGRRVEPPARRAGETRRRLRPARRVRGGTGTGRAGKRCLAAEPAGPAGATPARSRKRWPRCGPTPSGAPGRPRWTAPAPR